MRQKAMIGMADLVPEMQGLRAQGISLAAIADRLNQDGQVTRGGAAWRAAQVQRVLSRAEAVA
jgi:hypothetical protein